jgi:D-glycero-alpha-D-manno-heptose-7-phosphate kinase
MARAGSDHNVIVTRTPLRVSFAGGGTDLPDVYERGYGAVLSTAIDKYIYVTVKRHSPIFNEAIRINYSRSETVNSIAEIQNAIARECLRLLKIDPPVYVSTVGDLPASTGLGGSSAFAVGLLNALHAFRGERVAAGELAEEACHVEINVLKQPIGKQDQYAAAFGGLNLFCFRPGGGVTVEPQRFTNGTLHQLFDAILMFWTGHQRDASQVLSEQKQKTPQNLAALEQMRAHAYQLQSMLNQHVDLEAFGHVLDETWKIKRQLASTISTGEINQWYDRAMAAGAYGGKLCGAGGGGFLLMIAPAERHAAVRHALAHLHHVPVSFEVHGSRVLLGSFD